MPPPPPSLPTCLLIIGGGTMARTIVEGALAARVLAPTNLCVAENNPDNLNWFIGKGIATAPSALHGMSWLNDRAGNTAQGQVLLAIKPQSLPGLAGELPIGLPGVRRILITILAGTPSAVVRKTIAPSWSIIRAMPNTPARIGKGVTAVALGEGAQPGDDAFALKLFSALGPVTMTIDERLMDAFTAVASSGPAYVFYLAEAMAAAAIAQGFTPEQAAEMVRHTIAGAGALLAADPAPPESLRAAVTSKGGTTAAATTVFDQSNLNQIVASAIQAATARGAELAKLAQK